MERFGLVCFVLMMVVGTFIRQYAPKVTNVPYTVLLMICGMLAGAIIQSRNSHKMTAKSIREWYDITPEVLLWAIIPVLVFESAFNCDTHIFLKLKTQILTLAGPGVLIASIMTAAFVKVAFTEYGWDWPTSLMFGAMTSATDPVAVVSLLKELGVSERLGTLIEGESLLNDGTAIVVFEVFYDALEEDVCRPSMPTPSRVLLFLVRLGFVGPVLGCLCGMLATRWLASMLNDPFSEIIVTIVACYGAFALGEGVVGTSGVLTVVFCGMWINRYGKPNISAISQSAVMSFWGVFAHVANTVVFFVTGLIMAVKVFGTKKSDLGEECVRCSKEEEEEEEHDLHDDEEHDENIERRFLKSLVRAGVREISRRLERPEEAEEEVECHTFRIIDVWYLIQLYLALHVVRALVVFISAPVLWRGAYGMTVSQATVITYGGLRGAVGLALGLIINETEGFPSRLQNRILFQIAGIAFLTLMINGTTARYVLHWLKLDRRSQAQEEIFSHVSVDVDRRLASEMNTLRGDPYLADADWQLVWRYLPVLTSDSYWYRLRDNFVQLSVAEKSDLGVFAHRKKKQMQLDSERHHKKKSCTESLNDYIDESSYDSFSKRSSEYPLPKAIKAVWYQNHKQYGNTPPRFIHMSEQRLIATAHMGARDASLAASSRAVKAQLHKKSYSSEDDGGGLSSERPNLLIRAQSYGHGDIMKVVKGSALMKDQAHTQHHAQGMSMASPDEEDDDNNGYGNKVGTEQVPQLAATTRADLQKQHFDESSTTPSEKRIQALRQIDDMHLSVAEEQVLEEARERCLWAVKANLQVAYAKGRITPNALRVLQENVYEQEDNTSLRLDGWERLRQNNKASSVMYLQDAKSLVPSGIGIRNKLDGATFRKTALVFELAYNFVTAHEDVDLDELTDDFKIRKKLAAEVLLQQSLAKESIQDFQRAFPEIACAVKTVVASRFMLVHMYELFEELYDHGHLNEKECETAHDTIDEMRLKLLHHPYIEPPPHLETLLADIPFLAPLSVEERRTLVNDPVICRNELLLAGTVLAKQGKSILEQRSDHPGRTGWFVVIRGSVLVSQQQQSPTHISSPTHKDTQNQVDIATDDVVLGAGAVCCLEEQLLEMRFAASYKTISMCHVAFFDRDAMTALAARNAAVRFSLWWSVALSALRGYEDFAKLPARELDTLSRNAKFVEAPEDPSAYPNKPKVKKQSKSQTNKKKQTTMKEYGYATTTQRQAGPSGSSYDDPEAPLVEAEAAAAAAAASSSFVESQEAVYLSNDETKEQHMESWNQAKAAGAKSPRAVAVENDENGSASSDEDSDSNNDHLMLELELAAGHSLLILRGMAKTQVTLGPGGRPFAEVARAISIVSIDSTSSTRIVKLGFAAKAFILEDALLNTKGYDIHSDHNLILQDPTLADVHTTMQPKKNIRAGGLQRTPSVSWVTDHLESRKRRSQSQTKALHHDE